MIWPPEKIRELIAQAEIEGLAQAELKSVREAELFRYAIKNHKKNHKIGQDITTSVKDCVVTLRRRAEIRIREIA